MNNVKIIAYLGLVITTLLVSACGGPINLIKSGVYGVEESTPSGITFSKVTAYQDKGDFVVSGKLNRSFRNKSFPGHVDIAIVSPDGEIIATTSVKKYDAVHRSFKEKDIIVQG